jgi:hypothetical protein
VKNKYKRFAGMKSPFGPMVDPFGVHSRVLCRDMMGVVKFIGPTHLGTSKRATASRIIIINLISRPGMEKEE